MQDRRQSVRDKVLFGGVAEVSERGAAMNCVVRNFSDSGACVEMAGGAKLPEQVALKIARKGHSYLAQMIWRQAGKVGVAFLSMIADSPESDLDARLRRSEKKKRELQRRINELLGEG